jgi:hypothetical protein
VYEDTDPQARIDRQRDIFSRNKRRAREQRDRDVAEDIANNYEYHVRQREKEKKTEKREERQ